MQGLFAFTRPRDALGYELGYVDVSGTAVLRSFRRGVLVFLARLFGPAPERHRRTRRRVSADLARISSRSLS